MMKTVATVPTLKLVPAPPAPEPGVADEALVARIRAGDGAAGQTLVERYYAPLVRYLHRLTGSELTAEELHQQTWVSVLEHLDKFDAGSGTGGFKAWIFRIATNKANDLWRSRGREKTAKAQLRLVVDQEAPHADERAEGAEAVDQLKACIARLPENQRQVLMLRYYSDLKFVEIAEMLGCPLNTALGRMHKAMAKLKQMMEE